jgi:hypothetical protein
VDGNGLIGAIGCSHILAIAHQPANELVNPDKFTFEFRRQLQSNYTTNADPALRDFLKNQRKKLGLVVRLSASPPLSQSSKHDRYRRDSAK